MHEQMSGYKGMRREHQAALLKLEEKCKVEMEAHKNALDKEYDNLLHNFTRELERLEECDRKAFDLNRKKEYKANKERWKRELSMDESTPKRQRDLTLQSQKDNLKQAEAQEEQRLLTLQKKYIELEMRKFKRRRLIMLHELEDQLLRDYEQSIADMFQSQSYKLDESQVIECQRTNEMLEYELEVLTAYQNKIRNKLKSNGIVSAKS
ncbi:hypothetical protein EVAR_71351_1 [Eumeta japonica]|uniref:non-specific serine/threonine protein kinase n=1 Tax=Eumeta variegata TaxID=151549 RepID=A0A4C1SQY6_EUMVA|nr:hypothetical protein EVAR_71351_1 [Eumeta japonica]